MSVIDIGGMGQNLSQNLDFGQSLYYITEIFNFPSKNIEI
jgi:hypothetical protein